MFTCETGREVKCHREGMEMLQYYVGKETKAAPSTEESSQEDEGMKKKSDKPKAPLSLEEELAQLREQAPNHSKKKNQLQQDSEWGLMDLGCRGTVMVLRTRPDFNWIPPLIKHGISKEQKDNDATDKEEPDGKKMKMNGSTEMGQKPSTESSVHTKSSVSPMKDPSAVKRAIQDFMAQPSSSSSWNPVDVVREVLRETKAATNPEAPSSRFVTRMIPLQSTCFASLEEIVASIQLLLQRFLLEQEPDNDSKKTSESAPTTFAIHFKRRHCSSVSGNEAIEAIGKQVALLCPTWKVHLKNPDVKVWVEVCKNTAGISIFSTDDTLSVNTKFNLMELRAPS